VRVSEQNLTLDELQAADEVFISSTTRGLLPVREIAGRTLASSQATTSVCGRLVQAFHLYVSSDVARRRRAPVHA
jgi:branched-chain amino acid aminotransferase